MNFYCYKVKLSTMLEKEINSDRDKIYKVIKERRLCDAFSYIEELLDLETSPQLTPRFYAQKTTYSHMADYLMQGADDPERDKLYSNIINSLYEITDQLFDDIKINEVSDYIYDKRRYYRLKGGADIHKYVSLLKTEKDKYKLMKEAGVEESQILDSAKAIEKLQEEIFAIVASAFAFSEDEINAVKELLNTKEFGETTSSLVVSALTISALYFYSEDKILTLFNTYFSTDSDEVKQRALCGALILMYYHRDRVDMSEKIKNLIELFSDDKKFCNDVISHFLKFIRTLETEEILDRLSYEIYPDLVNLFSELDTALNKKEISENEFFEMISPNSDINKRINKNTLKKISEYETKLIEGFDILYSLYKTLKNEPFFDKITNWLRPYSSENSEIYPLIKRDSKFDQILTKSNYLCNSDRYSLGLYFYSQLMRENVKFDESEVDEDIYDIFGGTRTVLPGEEGKIIIDLYVQDLYRLFNLSKFRLTNIFDYHIDLSEVDVLNPILSTDETLLLIGEYYMKNGYFLYAQKYFRKLLKRDLSNHVFYQKIGYCKQRLKDYQGAIEEYVKADQIMENIWTFNQLAQCYKALDNIPKAIECYKDALRIAPDDQNLEFQLANCLMQRERYEEALKYYYKIDFMTDNSPKIWRQIVRCSLLLGKLEQAKTYNRKLLSSSPVSNDYMNMGHICLVQKKLKKACEYYRKSIELNKNVKDYFDKALMADYNTLIKLGASKCEIAIIRDILTKESRGY